MQDLCKQEVYKMNNLSFKVVDRDVTRSTVLKCKLNKFRKLMVVIFNDRG